MVIEGVVGDVRHGGFAAGEVHLVDLVFEMHH